MRLGIDISSLAYGTGVSDYTRDLLLSLIPLLTPGDQLRLIGFSARRRKLIQSQFPQANLVSLPPTVMAFLWNRLHLIPPETWLGALDVFHTSDWTQPPSRAALVTTIHDLSPFIFPQEMSSGGFRDIAATHKRKMWWAVRECRHFICVSKCTASDLQRLFSIPSSRISIIPEALPSRFLLPVGSTPISGDYLVTIGTPSPRKNIPFLINAFINLRHQYRLPEKLVVIGGGGWGGVLPPHPNVIYTGYLPDQQLVDILGNASALVQPSLYEGFGLPLLLGFHFSVPVIAANTGSFPEVAGTAAVLFDPRDGDSLAQAAKVALSRRKSLVSAGVERLKAYNWHQSATQTLAVYRSL